MGQRLGAALIATAMLVSTGPVSAAAPDSNEIERLYVEGQARSDAKDYTGAAESWSRLLVVLPESSDNQAIRESVIISVLDSHLDAYHQLTDEAGNKDIAHLQRGKAAVDRYNAEFSKVHADRAVAPAVQSKAAELERALARAEAEGATATSEPLPDDVATGDPTKPDTNEPEVIVLEAQNDGTGLIAGGAVAGVLGLAALSMIPIGSIRGERAEQRLDDARDAGTDTAKPLFDGEQANDILIAGAVLAPLLLAGSVTMIVLGVRQRRRAQAQRLDAKPGIDALAPRFDRNSVGVAIKGRF